MLHQQEDIHAIVLETQKQTFPDRGGLAVVFFLGVHFQSPLSKRLLLFRQPFGGLWEIGDDEDT